MKLIVGLGNPGEEYSKTRHNVGRSLIESIAQERRLSFAKKKSLKVSLASLEWENETVQIAYPETFMNLSGDAVALISSYYKIDPKKDILVISDDIDMEFGKVRFR